ncbi:MAG: DNA primase [Pseudomonadota bacterium]
MAGRIPQSFINDLINRLDIVDVVESRVQLKKSGKNYSGLCPFHDEKTPSFTVSPDKQFFHCFGCSESGTALTFIMKYERLEFVEAVEMVASQMGLEVPREGGGGRRERVDPSLYDILSEAESFYRKALRESEPAIAYLKSRGLTGEVARDFGIGYAPDAWQGVSDALKRFKADQLTQAGLVIENEKGRRYDRFRDRIMFPIRDTRGRVIGFGGRVMSPEQAPKYLNSPETPVFQKGNELYGLYEARRAIRQIHALIVVEGYMDVVALAQLGVANAVATLGTATGTAHFAKLYRYADEVVCCFDGDPAGRQAAWRALENALPALNEHRQLKLAFLPDGEDPDSLIRSRGKAGFSQFIDNAAPALDYLMGYLAEGIDLKSVDGKAKFSGLLQPYLEKLTSPLLLDLMRDRMSELMGRPVQVVQAQAPRTPRASRRQPASAGSDKISNRLLVLLLKNIRIFSELEESTRARLLEAAPACGLFGGIVQYISENPEADIEELLVYWSDNEAYARLLAMAQENIDLDGSTQRATFLEGTERLLANIDAQRRREALSALKESPNVDQLRTYWGHRAPSKPESD